MKKNEFIVALAAKCKGLPEEDVKKTIEYYAEMIDERMEDGMAEEEAVAAVGTVEEIYAQTVADTPFYKLLKQKFTPKRKLSGGEVALLAAGSPLWVVLTVAALICLGAVYVSLWAGVISLWAGFIGLVAGALSGVLGAIYVGVYATVGSGVAFFGAGLILAGISVIFFYGCKYATKGMILAGRALWLCIKGAFVKKEESYEE